MADKTPSLLQGLPSDVRTAAEAAMFKFKGISAIVFWGLNAACIAVFLGSRRFSTAERRAVFKRRTGMAGIAIIFGSPLRGRSLFEIRSELLAGGYKVDI
ncbi:hypothetical protein FGG08_001130 [Glutinoglossum americanum]|uniref:Uncharacterized protein n=1 Tax=Glutinoglossum americanum TaxID=1670608 RepID=A0A9P8IHB6_9PEZI|nr:hypothetical protein FGG08_001130 [Glutinoglossum americanum]